MTISTGALPRNSLILCALIALPIQACATGREPPPPVTVTVPVERPLPVSALEASLVRPDDGSLGGYLAQVESALTRCQAEIAARVE